jgi:hypothetical protein
MTATNVSQTVGEWVVTQRPAAIGTAGFRLVIVISMNNKERAFAGARAPTKVSL